MTFALACCLALYPGFAKQGHVLTPGCYVGAEDIEEGGELFAEKYSRLVAEVKEFLMEGERLVSAVHGGPGVVHHDK